MSRTRILVLAALGACGIIAQSASLACPPPLPDPPQPAPLASPPPPPPMALAEQPKIPDWLDFVESAVPYYRNQLMLRRNELEFMKREIADKEREVQQFEVLADQSDKSWKDSIASQEAMWNQAASVIVAKFAANQTVANKNRNLPGNDFARFRTIASFKGARSIEGLQLANDMQTSGTSCSSGHYWTEFNAGETWLFFFNAGTPSADRLIGKVQTRQISSPIIRQKLMAAAKQKGLWPTNGR